MDETSEEKPNQTVSKNKSSSSNSNSSSSSSSDDFDRELNKYLEEQTRKKENLKSSSGRKEVDCREVEKEKQREKEREIEKGKEKQREKETGLEKEKGKQREKDRYIYIETGEALETEIEKQNTVANITTTRKPYRKGKRTGTNTEKQTQGFIYAPSPNLSYPKSNQDK